MAIVIKSDPSDLRYARAPIAEFDLPSFEHVAPRTGDEVFWFTAETKGGHGLAARGSLLASEPNPESKRLRLKAAFREFDPVPLGKANFAELERVGDGDALQRLNRILYLHSLNKVAAIEDDVAVFLRARFREVS